VKLSSMRLYFSWGVLAAPTYLSYIMGAYSFDLGSVLSFVMWSQEAIRSLTRLASLYFFYSYF
jgi:hypothetical protein